MVNIPINSPVDLETYNVIQPEFSFKKKNSLVYKGVLHNLTKNAGDGFLSTTGKNIKVSGNNIIAGDSTFTPTIEAVVTENETIDTSDDVIFARKTSNGVSLLRKTDNKTLIKVTPGYTISPSNYPTAIDVNGTISSDGTFYEVAYYDSWTEVYRYSSTGSYLGGYSINAVLGSKSVTSYTISGVTYLGFDSEDMRKRYVYKNEGNTYSLVVHGLGLISEAGLVTGEPFFYNAHKTTTQRNAIAQASNLPTYDKLYGPISLPISYDENTSYSTDRFLDNGVRQTVRFPLDVSSATQVTSGTAAYYDTTTVTIGYWTSKTEGLGPNPDTYRSGSQSGAGNIENGLGIMDVNVPNVSGTTVHVYVYAIQIVSGTEWEVKAIPAMRRSPIGSFEDTNDWTKTWQSRARATEISFMNFSNPIGKTGSVDEGEQVFPHMRFFGNNTNEKGIYWDYGKGWVRFFYDTIHYLKYNNFGTAIYEEPLKLVTCDISGTRIDTVDVLNTSSNASYNQLGETTSDDTYYTTSNSSVMKETEWYSVPGLYSGKSVQGYDRSGFWAVRLHPLTTEQLAAKTWFYNHSLGGIGSDSLLSVVPFSFSTVDNFRVQNYALTNISLSYNKTLLFTPHDMGDNYSITIAGTKKHIATWSAGKVLHSTIEPTGTIKIDKATDYIFTTNIIGPKNVIIESRNGNFTFQRAFIPYIMESIIDPYIGTEYTMPSDRSSIISNDVYFYGFGFNSQLFEKNISSSFLVPAVTINFFVDSSVLNNVNKQVLNNKKGIFRADITKAFYDNENVEEYWTHSQATTDVLYKNSRYLVSNVVNDSYDSGFADTTWFPTAETTIYPIGILSKTRGENYITSTVDVGDNYAARFYNKNNKTFLVYNMKASVYYGSEIFTIQSGNYYFDGQGIYYLGSQTDYSQNVFTAYAIGMKFLANSSSEAYFYSKWDKCLYLYTASNTLQRSISFADMGDIVDSLYSSAEQALYVLFEDGKLFVKTQSDSCIIEGVTGNRLQSTDVGCQVISDSKYEAYNPWMWNTLLPLEIETEYLGNPDTVTKYKYVDFVFYTDNPSNYDYEVEFDTLNGTEIKKEKIKDTIQKAEWKNNLMRVRLVPSELQGNALKIFLKSNNIYLFSLSVDAEQTSTMPSAPRNMRH